jgi:hypothetical protein
LIQINYIIEVDIWGDAGGGGTNTNKYFACYLADAIPTDGEAWSNVANCVGIGATQLTNSWDSGVYLRENDADVEHPGHNSNGAQQWTTTGGDLDLAFYTTAEQTWARYRIQLIRGDDNFTVEYSQYNPVAYQWVIVKTLTTNMFDNVNDEWYLCVIGYGNSEQIRYRDLIVSKNGKLSYNSGNVDSGTQRVVIASNQVVKADNGTNQEFLYNFTSATLDPIIWTTVAGSNTYGDVSGFIHNSGGLSSTALQDIIITGKRVIFETYADFTTDSEVRFNLFGTGGNDTSMRFGINPGGDVFCQATFYDTVNLISTQGNWNVDKADALGNSKFSEAYNENKLNGIRIEYLPTGSIIYSIFEPTIAKWIIVHIIKYGNDQTFIMAHNQQLQVAINKTVILAHMNVYTEKHKPNSIDYIANNNISTNSGVVDNGTQRVVLPTDQPAVLIKNPTLELHENSYANSSVFYKFGGKIDVDTSWVDLYDGNADYPFLTSANQIYAVSDNVNDTLAGSGAQQVYIDGLDTNFDGITEIVDLGGTTEQKTNGSFRRVNRAYVQEAGEYTGANKGLIKISDTGQTNIYCTISNDSDTIGYGQSTLGVYTVPNGKRAFITSISLSADVSNNNVINAVFYKRENADNTTDYSPRRIMIQFKFQNYVERVLNSWIELPSKTDIWWRVKSSQNNTHVSCSWNMILCDV